MDPSAALCTHAGCQSQLETLTHAFLSCPAVAPAAAWLCALFAAVSGQPPPPAHAQVLLADDCTVWQPQPASLAFLWANMRMCYLLSIWRLRCRRSLTGKPFDAAAVAAATVVELRTAIARDWTRTNRDLTRLDASYWEWFRGRDPSLDLDDFEARWAHRGVLCAVHEGQLGVPRLQLLLSPSFPVPLPVPGPAAAPGAAHVVADVLDL